MPAFDASTYGDSFADVYDEWYGDADDARGVVDFVATFASSQRMIELGVGTGRLSEPLAAAGHTVVGVDASLAMLEGRAAPAAGPATTALLVGADMAALPVRSGWADLVLVATNTLFNLDTVEAQNACFESARAALRLGGRLVVQAFVPRPPDPALDAMVTTRSITPDRVVLIATIRDVETQRITGQHIDITEQGIRLRPWRLRYASPAQLDEQAAVHGFRLGDRFADWSREPFGDDSTAHVSVYVAV